MSITIEQLWHDRKRYFGLPLSFTRYSLSDDRLFISVGFLNIKDDEILLYRVRDIDTSRTLWQRIFGVGTVTVVSSDKTMPTLVLKNIKDPVFVKVKRRVRFGEIMATGMEDEDDTDLDEMDDEM